MNPFKFSGLFWLGLIAIRVFLDKRAQKRQQPKDAIIDIALEPVDPEWQSVGGGPQSLQIKTKQIEHRKAR